MKISSGGFILFTLSIMFISFGAGTFPMVFLGEPWTYLIPMSIMAGLGLLYCWTRDGQKRSVGGKK